MRCIAEWKSISSIKATTVLINALKNTLHTTEGKLALTLGLVVIIILSLSAALTRAWGWSWLGTCTLLFVISYPLLWFSWRIWKTWALSLMRLTTYVQSLSMGESGVEVAKQGKSELIDDLVREIKQLHQQFHGEAHSKQPLVVLLSQLFEELPIAVIIFDAEFSLTYANQAAYDINDISLLRGMTATELGFLHKAHHLHHPRLADNWRCHSSFLNYRDQSVCLFTAIDISSELKRSEQAVQENLVRVLSHELRNTLTPMSSMAQTLLSMQQLDESQIRKVLERIRTRADGMLNFIQRFAEVAKIPEPKKESVDIKALVEQTRVLLRNKDTLVFHGAPTCHADPHLMAQVLMNLVKNAVESSKASHVDINIRYYQSGNQQVLQVSDNGAGFSNIDNAITPLFTTKPDGAGIGLAFVETVINKHGGKLRLSNQQGALVELTWPVQT